MEFKHFSHNHNLIFQQLPPGNEIKCSGCKSSGSGSVYVCWQCSYFLHEQCFRATRSLKHHLHPLHPLTLVPYPTHPSNSFYCDSCSLIGGGFSYCCSECEFDLHVHCAMNPNPTVHQSHHSHPHPQNLYPNPNFSPNLNNYPGNFASPPNVISNEAQPPAGQTGYVPNNMINNIQATSPSGYPVNFAPPPAAQTVYDPHPLINNIQSPPPPSGYPTNFAPPVSVITNQAPPPAAHTNYVPNPGNQQSTINQPIPVFPPPSVTVQIQSAGTSQPKVEEIKHFSHVHALELRDFEKKDAKKCAGCEMVVDGIGYSCVEPQCNYSLDKTCFEAPMEVKHNSHLDHPLTLLAKSRYESGQFTCNACLKDGSGFVYNCATCSFDLHSDCISWPKSVKREDHKHPLTLFYASPAPKTEGQEEVTCVCDVCRTAIHDMAWTYYCHECDFSTHLECVIAQVLPVEKSEEEMIQEAALKLKVLQLLLSGAQIN